MTRQFQTSISNAECRFLYKRTALSDPTATKVWKDGSKESRAHKRCTRCRRCLRGVLIVFVFVVMPTHYHAPIPHSQNKQQRTIVLGSTCDSFFVEATWIHEFSRPIQTTIAKPPIQVVPYRQFRGKKMLAARKTAPKRVVIVVVVVGSLSSEDYGTCPVQAIDAAWWINLATIVLKVFVHLNHYRQYEHRQQRYLFILAMVGKNQDNSLFLSTYPHQSSVLLSRYVLHTKGIFDEGPVKKLIGNRRAFPLMLLHGAPQEILKVLLFVWQCGKHNY